MALSLRKKSPEVPTGSRGTASGVGARASQRPCTQLAGKRKPNELASLGDWSEPVNRGPATRAGSAPLSTTSSVTGELPAVGNSGCPREE
jgi:hypothetical protein